MIDLPKAYTARMRSQLGDKADAYFDALEQPYVRGLRIHPRKTPAMPLETQIDGIEGTIPWADDGRYLNMSSAAGSHPLHACGAYYIQEPSAMLPAALLHAQPGETVLDLCAAPGGKGTQLAAQMRGQGTLVCNEIVPSRAETLSGNLERMGVRNALVVSQDPRRLSEAWPQLFDAILVDAPCSGEGMFRRHPETRREWTPETPARCAQRQRFILESAARMLKTGGRLCYSTCTFSEEENEAVVGAFLASHTEFEAIPFSVPVGNGHTLHAHNGCVRLYPHTVQGEGHFAALLQKTGAFAEGIKPAVLSPAQTVFTQPDKQAIQLYRSLMAELSACDPPNPNAAIGSLLISAPQLPPLHRIKAYRAGLPLGRLKGRVFLPDHALAPAAPPLTLRSIPLDSVQITEYMRGEVLPAGDMTPGFWTVTCAGLPLGWVKHSDEQLKNHYPKGLRKR